MKLIDLTGRRFGRLVVQHIAQTKKGKRLMWHCKCECGCEKIAVGNDLRAGSVSSCGCLIGQHNIRHGLSKTRTHNIWSGVIRRCVNPNDASYQRYGGKGIAVCDRWKVFENFLADMGEAPAGLSIDRIDNSKGYSPENCRWADDFQQSNNRDMVLSITAFGRSQTLGEWSKETGIAHSTIYQRMRKLKWPPEKALSSQVRRAAKEQNHASQ